MPVVGSIDTAQMCVRKSAQNFEKDWAVHEYVGDGMYISYVVITVFFFFSLYLHRAFFVSFSLRTTVARLKGQGEHAVMFSKEMTVTAYNRHAWVFKKPTQRMLEFMTPKILGLCFAHLIHASIIFFLIIC